MSMWPRSIVLTVAALCVTACSSAPSQRQLAQDAVTAMGGTEKLKGIQTIMMKGAGTRTSIGQMPKEGAPDAMGQLTNVVETVDVANGRAALDYKIQIGGFMMERKEVLTKRGDKPIGLETVDNVTLAVPVAGLFSWGTQNSPDFLLRRNVVGIAIASGESASAAEAAQDKDFNGKMHKYAKGKTPDGEDVDLYFDPASKLLAGFEVLDTETMLGDVQAQYILSDHKAVDGVTLPHHVTIRKGGQDYSDIQYESITLNDAAAEAVFMIPDAVAAQADLAADDKDYFPMKLVKVAPNVFQAQAFRHHSLVVEFPTFVAVVEAAYLEVQSKALAKAIEKQFPGKPIKYAAVTHYHFDHAGGVRGIAAKGATILVAKGHDAVVKTILDAPHTHPPDELATRRRANQAVGSMEVFEDKKVISDGGQSLELYAFTGSPHVEPMVMAYVPGSRVLFQSDLWIPGLGLPGSPEAAQLLDSIKKLNLRVDTMVGGHGTVGPSAELTKAIAAMPK